MATEEGTEVSSPTRVSGTHTSGRSESGSARGRGRRKAQSHVRLGLKHKPCLAGGNAALVGKVLGGILYQ